MPWIEPDAVAVLVQTDLTDDPWIPGLIDHAEQLIEAEIGAQDEYAGLPAGLAAITAQVVARLWRAGKAANVNPAGHNMEVLGPHTFQAGNLQAGWGLTRGEKDALAKFRSKLWVQPTHVADALESPPGLIPDTAGGDPILWQHPDEAD